MFKPDVIFLHAPSVYDFRKKPVIHGPISDVIPSGPVFEMYPVGFLSLCGHLEKAGVSTRIINIANKMLNSLKYDPEDEIAKLKPRAFAIDLHWLPHVQGSLAIGEIVKKYHPEIPIIYGGYSSTFFHRELIEYPFVDFVLRGDSTEMPMVKLMQAIMSGGDLASIPNLSFKDSKGTPVHNELSHVPVTTDFVMTDYGLPIKKTLKFFDLNGYIPFQIWMKYPVTAVFLYRGCLHNCRTCGGSKFSCENTFNRKALAFKSPDKVADEVRAVAEYINGPCFIIGDILQNGREYAVDVLHELKKLNLQNDIALEFFVPPKREFIELVKDSIPKFNVEISPESHDEEVRRAFGRPFDNNQIEEALAACVDNGCRRIDLFFMTGLPKQTYASVLETVEYCGYLLEKFGRNKTVFPFISPLAPFIDPGSEVWDNPEKHGYTFFAKTLEEHRQLMEKAVSWKYFLDYETKWMSRDDIVFSTYEAGIRLNELKRKHGLITEKTYQLVSRRARQAVEYMKLVDQLVGRGEEGRKELEEIFGQIRDLNVHTICHKDELNWPVSFYKFNLFRILALILNAGMKKVARNLFGKHTVKGGIL